MGDGCGVPAFREHGHADDAPHFASGRNAGVEGYESVVIIFKCAAVVLFDHGHVLFGRLVAGPGSLADGFKDESKTPSFIVFATTIRHVFGRLAVHANGPFTSGSIVELFR